MSDLTNSKLDCNKCVWSTRDGGCASWDCEFIDRDDAVKAWRQLSSAEPEVRCIAEIKFSKEDLEELVDEKANDFLNFLFNMINPNDMEDYLAMYNSQGENGE